MHGLRLSPGDVLHADPAAVAYEVDLGHLVETTIGAECRPLEGLAEAERAALPEIMPEGEGRAVVADGRMHTAAGTGEPMRSLEAMPDDAMRELIAEFDAALEPES